VYLIVYRVKTFYHLDLFLSLLPCRKRHGRGAFG
jgi:hypothetical protein